MGAQALFCFVAFFAMFVSSLTGKNTTEFFSDKVVVNVNLHSDKNVDTVLSQLQKKLESFEGRLNALEKPGMYMCLLIRLQSGYKHWMLFRNVVIKTFQLIFFMRDSQDSVIYAARVENWNEL